MLVLGLAYGPPRRDGLLGIDEGRRDTRFILEFGRTATPDHDPDEEVESEEGDA